MHSWGSALTHHPHVHVIVPGGGIAPDGQRWIACRPGFFLPVRVLSRLFRRLFLERLVAAYDAGRLRFFGDHALLSEREAFTAYLAPLRKAEWIVYSKRPFGGPEAVLAYLSRYTVHDILNKRPVKPHKVRYYLNRRDPAFDERKAEVIELYAAAEMLRELPEAERPVAILSYDEKPGIQAIATTAPDLPPKPGKHPTVQRDHEYKRLGTVTLSAAVDLVTGVVHHAVTQRHRSREFVAFLQQLDTAYPVGVLICVLLDNHSAHRSRETRRFLATKPGRFEFVFTPTHASWLNWVETFFSKMARSVLRRIRVTSKDELRDRIRRYIETCNQSPLAPKWSYGIHRDQELLAA